MLAAVSFVSFLLFLYLNALLLCAASSSLLPQATCGCGEVQSAEPGGVER